MLGHGVGVWMANLSEQWNECMVLKYEKVVETCHFNCSRHYAVFLIMYFCVKCFLAYTLDIYKLSDITRKHKHFET